LWKCPETRSIIAADLQAAIELFATIANGLKE
jgi:hypothetical protein